MNIAGIFTHYPSEQAQRQGFLETRGFVQTKINLQNENEEQVRDKMGTSQDVDVKISGTSVPEI